MKKYRYVIEFVTDNEPPQREQCQLASALHQLIVECAAETGTEVYASVGFEKPTEISEIELEQFKKDAGYDV